MIETETAKLKYVEWMKFCHKQRELVVSKVQLESELKLIKHHIRMLEKIWDDCEEHDYGNGYCIKCGIPDFSKHIEW